MHALAKASVFSALLAIGKGLVFAFSGSMIVAASMVDSLVDSLISLTNYKMQKLAKQKADQEHPFGHGGLEVIASLVQGLVIAIAGISIVSTATNRLLSNTEQPSALAHTDLALAMLLVSAFAGLWIQRSLAKHTRQLDDDHQRSLILAADQAHYLSDFVMNLSGALGLILVYLSGQSLIDAAFGLIGGILVIKTSYPIIKQSIADIMHHKLDSEDQQRLVDTAMAQSKLIKGLHRLRSRRLGPYVFVDFHLKLPQDLALKEAHRIGEQVAAALRDIQPNLDVMIHLDPDDEPDDDLFAPEFTVPDPQETS